MKAVMWDMGGVLVRTEDQSPRDRLAKKELEKLGVGVVENLPTQIELRN